MHVKELAQAVGCSQSDVRAWRQYGWLSSHDRNVSGMAVDYSDRNLAEAKVLHAAKQLNMPLRLVAHFLDRIPAQPRASMILVIRWSGELLDKGAVNLFGSRLAAQPEIHAVVMHWSDFDPSDGRSFLIVGL